MSSVPKQRFSLTTQDLLTVCQLYSLAISTEHALAQVQSYNQAGNLHSASSYAELASNHLQQFTALFAQSTKATKASITAMCSGLKYFKIE